VSLRTVPCPGCGATLTFQSAASVCIVCPYCGGGSMRTDRALESFGTVAELAPIESPLELYHTGRFGGLGWTAVGLLQLDHGAGPWNEWCLLFDDGTWGWYAEAQGQTLLTRKVEGVAAPIHSELAPDQELEIAGHGRYVVAEVGEARLTSARGELPVRVVPGTTVRYADLRAADGGFGTLDYGVGITLEHAYVGREVDPKELGLDPEKAVRAEKRVEAKRLQCAQCGGAVRMRDPASLRVVCESCGTLLAPDAEGTRAFGKAALLASHPTIPLGTKGTLRGTSYEVLAYLVRSVRVDGTRYPWSEYLLRTPKGAYHWLVESSGHWLRATPVGPGKAKAGGLVGTYGGRTFRHFQGGEAVVDHVQGEVYWAVAVGEKMKVADYVDPPFLLSVERTGKETNVSVGEYLPVEEVAAAFPAAERIRAPVGVAPAQPNPYVGSKGKFWGAGCLMTTVLGALMLAIGSAAGGANVGALFPGAVLAFALLLPAIVVQTRASTFEVRRWADSDHPMTRSSDDDE